jgi:myo-inositol-1-phosphate synthase
MFTARNLKVLSWQSQNLLGNRDGMVLEDPDHKKAKLANKDQGLRKLLGDENVHSQVRIDYVPSLGDWKTAWDFIHFEGFLGTRMQLQFTWQGCDSALAAPLVIDLVRFLEFAHRRGESGLQRHLSPFFKAPYGVDEQDFATQMEMLYDYAQKHRIQTRRVVRSESPS